MRDFAVKFLELPGPIYGKNWPDDLFAGFVEKFRSAIGQPRGIVWVNPVALLRYSPADQLFGPAHGGGPWADIKTASIFQPIAIVPDGQSQLDAAFTAIIRDHDGQHLSQALDEMSFGPDKFYECSASAESIISIRCSGSTDVIKTIANRNYDDLFKLSPRILFLPTPVFSLRVAQSPIHTNCLLGSYVGVLGDFECKSHGRVIDCRNCPLDDRRLRDALDWAERLFFARRRLDHANELKKLLDQTREHGDLHKMQRIRPALDRVADSFASVTRLREHLEEIKSVIDPEHMSPGSAKYSDISSFLDLRVFQTGKHEVFEHVDEATLKKAVEASEFVRDYFSLQSQMAQRLSKAQIDSMFSVWAADKLNQGTRARLPSVALAKWISKEKYTPLAWMKAVAGMSAKDEDWFLAALCAQHPIGVCCAIAGLVRDGFTVEFGTSGNIIELTLARSADEAGGLDGLRTLLEYASCETGGGESARCLRHLRRSVKEDAWAFQVGKALTGTISFSKNETKKSTADSSVRGGK